MEISPSTDFCDFKIKGGNAKGIPPFFFRIIGISHCFHKVKQEPFLLFGQRAPSGKQDALFFGQFSGSSPSAKNCAKVMPNALQTASRVGSVGALFLLNIFVTVECDVVQ